MINRLRHWDSYIIFGLVLFLWLLQTKTIHASWSETTRLAAVQSLVEHGTWRIDASPYGHETGDKLLLDGHYYSDKPPLFAAIGALFYAPMYYGLGVSLAVDGCQPGRLCVFYWLTVLMVGLPSAWLAVLFYRLARHQTESITWAVILTFLLCFGTIVWPYSLVFNHHLPAAIALFVSSSFFFQETPNRFYVCLAGLLVGTAVMFDLTAVFLAFSIFIIAVIYNRRDILFFIGASLIPLIATIIFNYQITGGPLLPYFSSEGYNYPGSPWDTTVGGQHPPDNMLLYAFRSLVGDYGMFGYSPLLFFSVAGLMKAIDWTKFRSLLGQSSVMVKSRLILLGIVAHLMFVFTRTNNFGGDAYGWRFLIPIIPILFFFIIFFIPACFYQARGLWWKTTCFCIAALLSLFSAYQGVQATWHNFQPPIFAKIVPAWPYLTIETNFRIPEPRLVSGDDRIKRDFEMPFIPHRLDVVFNNELTLLGYDLSTRRMMPGETLELTLYWQLLRVPEQDYFVFTHLLNEEHGQQAGIDRQLQEGYPVRFWFPGEVVIDKQQIPIKPDAAADLAWLRLGMYKLAEGYTPVPLTINGQTTQETSLTLGKVLIGTAAPLVERQYLSPEKLSAVQLGQPPLIALYGYDLAQMEDSLQLTLYWESLQETDLDWSVFVHLRDDLGQVVAQQDRLAGSDTFPTSLWQREEIIRDPFRLTLPPDVETGWYKLVAGLYQPDTGTRLMMTSADADSIELDTIHLER